MIKILTITLALIFVTNSHVAQASAKLPAIKNKPQQTSAIAEQAPQDAVAQDEFGCSIFSIINGNTERQGRLPKIKSENKKHRRQKTEYYAPTIESTLKELEQQLDTSAQIIQANSSRDLYTITEEFDDEREDENLQQIKHRHAQKRNMKSNETPES